MPNSVFVNYRNASLTNALTLVRTGQCNIYGWIINNPNASEAFVQVFDAAAVVDVTLGVTTCTLPLKVGAGSAVVLRDGLSTGITFSNGIVIAATTTEAGAVAPATALSMVLFHGSSV